MNLDNAARFANFIGVFLQADNGLSYHKIRSFLYVQVNVDVSHALKSGVFIRNGDGSHQWLAFKYERLSDFCYFCGKLGHVSEGCRVIITRFVGPRDPRSAYGGWMNVKGSRSPELSWSKPSDKATTASH